MVVHGGVLHALHTHATGGRAFVGNLLNASLSSVFVDCSSSSSNSSSLTAADVDTVSTSSEGATMSSRAMLAMSIDEEKPMHAIGGLEHAFAATSKCQGHVPRALHGVARSSRLAGGGYTWVLMSWNSVDHLVSDGGTSNQPILMQHHEHKEPVGGFGGGDMGG